MHSLSIAQDSNALSLDIQLSETNPYVLICTVQNNSNEEVKIDDFNLSNLNRITVFNPNRQQVSYSLIHNTQRKKITLAPNEKLSREYDLNPVLNPIIKVRPLPEGNYKINWMVNGIKAEPFSFEFRK